MPSVPVMTRTNDVGFAPGEIRLDLATREARLKWVIVVDESLPAGLAVNAAVCIASGTATGVGGLMGPATPDATGSPHPGLPWIGCSVLGATRERLAGLRAAAADRDDVFVADMPAIAQETRVYTDYVGKVAASDGLDYLAVSLVGPRKAVDKLVRGLSLLA